MSSIEAIRKSIMTERIRMSQVRKAFGAGLDGSPAPAAALAFYPPCCEYLQAALGRLHTQDQRIIELLTPLVPQDATQDLEILKQFQTGLDASQVALDRLMQVLAEYRASKDTAQLAFEDEARAFLEVFINVLGARRHTSSHLEDEHFDVSDWASVADINDDAKQLEQQLFAAVKAAAPEGADPDLFRAGPPPN
ncbi:MAG: hypothetical protein V3R81_15630 [Gammaproteobacteria bacterium]